MKTKLCILMVWAVMACVPKTGAQDINAAINTTWQGYAVDTSLTYQQIVTLCDSLFAQAGFGVADTWPGTTIRPRT